MSFEMLGSRYLNPYFGSGIYTWAALISTVLLALTVGYFLGGYLADRTASPTVLAVTVMIGSVYLLALPSFAQAILEFVLAGIDDIRAGSLLSSLAIMLFPVTFLGMYRHSPSGCCCPPRNAPAGSQGRSTASLPQARSSARSAPPSS